MKLFKQWTNGQMITGVVLVILLGVLLLAQSFISDYENAKQQTIQQATSETTELNTAFQEEAGNAQARVDEQLRASSDDSPLTKDVKVRDDYIEIQRILFELGVTADAESITPKAMDAFKAQLVPEAFLLSVYIQEDDPRSGTAYYIGDSTVAFQYTYTDGRIDTLEHIGTFETQEVGIVEE